ncbi:MAG: universal stress protein [Polyangiaceae bacterium]
MTTTLPKSILVATDFGPTSEQALDYAMHLARAVGARVTVVHTYDIPSVGLAQGALVGTSEMIASVVADAQAALDGALARRKDSGVAMNALLESGDPREVIHAVAEKIGADLVVMGTHGRRGLSRWLIGSVAESVVRTSTRPVLTVRGPNGT